MYDEEGKICETVTSYWRSLAPHTADDEEHPSRLDQSFFSQTQKRPNTEPQGVPEFLD